MRIVINAFSARLGGGQCFLLLELLDLRRTELPVSIGIDHPELGIHLRYELGPCERLLGGGRRRLALGGRGGLGLGLPNGGGRNRQCGKRQCSEWSVRQSSLPEVFPTLTTSGWDSTDYRPLTSYQV